MKRDSKTGRAPRAAGAAGFVLAASLALAAGCAEKPPAPAADTAPAPAGATPKAETPKTAKGAPARRAKGPKMFEEADYSSIAERRRMRAKANAPGG
jgi:hypothetical protein